MFNDRWNLKNLLEDLNNQTFKDFRAIFIDDGSTDNTKALFDSMKGKLLFRYKYFRTQNSGQAAARFFGYKHIESSTRFVTFVDGDDRIKNDYVRSLVENLMLYKPLNIRWHLRNSPVITKLRFGLMIICQTW